MENMFVVFLMALTSILASPFILSAAEANKMVQVQDTTDDDEMDDDSEEDEEDNN